MNHDQLLRTQAEGRNLRPYARPLGIGMMLARTAAMMGRLFALAVLLSPALVAQTSSETPVVVVSIDGLKPDCVLEATKYGLRIPNLRRFLTEGAYASGVAGVLPSSTFPSHTTLMTGVSPAKHGIYANRPFDPFGKNMGGSCFYAEDIRVPALWDAAARKGLTTGAVHWPVTVGADITCNIPAYWRTGTEDDIKLLRVLSTPGLFAEIERAVGPYAASNDESFAADERRLAYAVQLYATKKPRLMLIHLDSLDGVQHKQGPYSRDSFETIEHIDALLGTIRSSAGIDLHRAILCVVSDHGFAPVSREVRLNFALRNAALLTVDQDGKLTDYRAIIHSAGGSAAVRLKDPGDHAARLKTRELLDSLTRDPTSGVLRFYEGDQIAGLRGFPDADFVVMARIGFTFVSSFEGPIVKSVVPRGNHGYSPELTEMDSAFFISGPGIPTGRALGRMDMRDVAPTLAELLGVELPGAEGRDLLAVSKTAP
ncbi:MAG: ectonucleotide pyrophosphatase/phosphodiesterase [Acidobacteriota bacterium]